MKRIFYFAAMALAACAVMVSCEKEQTTTKTNRLATPQVTATVGETEVSVSWEAIENAVSYEYTVDDGTAENITATSFTIPVADLTIGSHTVSVKAIPEEGAEYKESRPGTATFEIKGQPSEPVEALAAWFGTYNVKSTYGLSATDDPDQGVAVTKVDEPVEFQIAISAFDDPTGDSVAVVTGWSAWATDATAPTDPTKSMPALAQLLPDGTLALLADVSLGDDGNGNGVEMMWSVMGQLSGIEGFEGAYSTIRGCGYFIVLANNAGTISVVNTVAGDLGVGGSFTGVGMDIFGSKGKQAIFYNIPWTMPAGEFTFTKTGNNAPAPAMSIDPMLPVTMTMTDNAVAAMSVSPIAR